MKMQANRLARFAVTGLRGARANAAAHQICWARAMSASGGNPKVFFDIDIGGKPAGKIVFELFNDVTPKVRH